MAQLNMHLDATFERELAQLVKLRRAPSKSEAVRTAVREALERSKRRAKVADFRRLVGLAAAAPQNPAPRFQTDDDLWSAAGGR